eukprot:TRINITY_DN39960_c2_g1_i5.p1 TRINITY_DN39960_c2_g1~~TRINITY_DN39960_c2_g1_i5.p1  ORF type:complete len:458 (-),score=138.02 TRINITY_DN39960_c2_g1_i5:38-1411(-)
MHHFPGSIGARSSGSAASQEGPVRVTPLVAKLLKLRGASATEPDESAQMADIEAELQRQCAELAEQLSQDPLSFENKALEVQLMQMKDDFASLQEDFKSTRKYYGTRISEMEKQLEASTRAAVSAEGQAECLDTLLHFNEEQGSLAGSYWQAQCEKRDDSIRFLTLKLQEYTVLSDDYWQKARSSSESRSRAASEPLPSSLASAAKDSAGGAAAAGGQAAASAVATPWKLPGQSASEAYQKLVDDHEALCKEVAAHAETSLKLEKELQACQLRCLEHQWRQAAGAEAEESASPGGQKQAASSAASSSTADAAVAEAEDDCESLERQVAACEEAIAAAFEKEHRLPVWAKRCTWRDELDVRAGQLERISSQFDAAKRSLDAANEELQWQATRAEAMRMRLLDLQMAAKTEDARTRELHSTQQESLCALEANAAALATRNYYPIHCLRPQLLLKFAPSS